jgi:hypothetical protein
MRLRQQGTLKDYFCLATRHIQEFLRLSVAEVQENIHMPVSCYCIGNFIKISHNHTPSFQPVKVAYW